MPHLSKILRSLPLVAVAFIAGNAPQLLGRATEVLRGQVISVRKSHFDFGWLIRVSPIFPKKMIGFISLSSSNRSFTIFVKWWHADFQGIPQISMDLFLPGVPCASLLVSPSPWKTRRFFEVLATPELKMMLTNSQLSALTILITSYCYKKMA